MGSVTGRWRLGDVRDARGLGDVRSASACRVNGLRLSSRARRDAASERRRPNLPDTRPEDRFPPAMVSWGAAQCVLRAEAGDEASAGERIGQPLSRERINRGADAVVSAVGFLSRRRNGTRLSLDPAQGPAAAGPGRARLRGDGGRPCVFPNLDGSPSSGARSPCPRRP